MLTSTLLLSILSLSLSAPIAPITEDDLVLPGLEIRNETPEEIFVRIDQNDDKDLSFDEFLHMDLVYEQAKKEEFELLDTNNDGKVSKEEYDARTTEDETKKENAKNKYFSAIFKEFDADGDKSLSEEELRKIIQKRFLLEPRDNFGKIVSGFDADASGGLDIMEYMKMDEEFPFDQTDPIKPKKEKLPPKTQADLKI